MVGAARCGRGKPQRRPTTTRPAKQKHSVNNFAVRSVDGLRVLLDDAKANRELVLQVEQRRLAKGQRVTHRQRLADSGDRRAQHH
jgi:hypothetical protein